MKRLPGAEANMSSGVGSGFSGGMTRIREVRRDMDAWMVVQ